MHDDRLGISWKMAVVEELVIGGDGFVCAANIQTCNGKTNRPIIRLYPLEVRSPHEAASSETLKIDNTTNPKMSGTNTQHISDRVPTHPVGDSARKERNKLARWADNFLAPPEDVGN